MRDICSNKHGGNSESVAAFEETSENYREAMRESIYGIALARGASGVTTDEVARIFSKPPNAVSGRLTDLKKAGRLIATNDCRKTQAGRSARVFVADRFAQ